MIHLVNITSIPNNGEKNSLKIGREMIG